MSIDACYQIKYVVLFAASVITTRIKIFETFVSGLFVLPDAPERRHYNAHGRNSAIIYAATFTGWMILPIVTGIDYVFDSAELIKVHEGRHFQYRGKESCVCV
jgi:hypothetical protein